MGQLNDTSINGNLTVTGNILGNFSAIFDQIYSIGAVLISTDSNYDPNDIFTAQTWERFAKGQTLVGVNESDTDFASVNKTGGAKTVTLTTAQMPSHTHTFTGSAVTSGNNSASHYHAISLTSGGGGSHWHTIGTDYDGAGGSIYGTVHKNSSGAGHMAGYTSTASSHTHSVSGNSGNNSASHTHNVTANGKNANTGSGNAHSNLQPYITVYYWKRIA